MKKVIHLVVFIIASSAAMAQNWKGKFEQLGTTLPTPNEYRTASGAPGQSYWQQQADYVIAVILDDEKYSISGTETITYTNNSPDPLSYLWVQLDQNVRAKDSNTPKVSENSIRSLCVALS